MSLSNLQVISFEPPVLQSADPGKKFNPVVLKFEITASIAKMMNICEENSPFLRALSEVMDKNTKYVKRIDESRAKFLRYEAKRKNIKQTLEELKEKVKKEKNSTEVAEKITNICNQLARPLGYIFLIIGPAGMIPGIAALTTAEVTKLLTSAISQTLKKMNAPESEKTISDVETLKKDDTSKAKEIPESHEVYHYRNMNEESYKKCKEVVAASLLNEENSKALIKLLKTLNQNDFRDAKFDIQRGISKKDLTMLELQKKDLLAYIEKHKINYSEVFLESIEKFAHQVSEIVDPLMPDFSSFLPNKSRKVSENQTSEHKENVSTNDTKREEKITAEPK